MRSRLLRRRRYIVHLPRQLRFIGLLLLQMGVVLTALFVLVRSHLGRLAEIADDVGGDDPVARASFQGEFLDAIHGFGVRAGVMLAVTAGLIAVLGLLASHRLAGPIHKLERYFARLADGDVSQRIAFRGSDHLEEFAARVNLTAEALEQRRIHAGELAFALGRLAETLPTAEDRAPVLAEMQALLAQLEEAA